MRDAAFSRFLALAGVLAGVVSCGGGGTDLAGIGGTGITASGEITGFGSVIVNGIEFETGPSTIIDADGNVPEDGSDAQAAGLRIGMVVTVRGRVDPGGITGVADSITYDDLMEGPIADEPRSDIPDSSIKTFHVFGVNVIVERDVTHFDGEFDDFSFDTIEIDDVVELSGFFDAAGNLHATRVEKEGVRNSAGGSQVEVKGEVMEFDETNNLFTLKVRFGDGITVKFDQNTDLEDLPGGLADGLLAEVEGVLKSDGIIYATEIEAEGEEFGQNEDNVSIEGFVSNFVSLADFSVNQQQVNASGAMLEPRDLKLANGMRVEVEGPIENGVLKARELHLAD